MPASPKTCRRPAQTAVIHSSLRKEGQDGLHQETLTSTFSRAPQKEHPWKPVSIASLQR
jgi:hypothetical protein